VRIVVCGLLDYYCEIFEIIWLVDFMMIIDIEDGVVSVVDGRDDV